MLALISMATILLAAEFHSPLSTCPTKLAILAAEIGVGSSKPGAELGPEALLKSNLKQRIKEIGFSLAPTHRASIRSTTPPSFPALHEDLRLRPALRRIQEWIVETRTNGNLPIILGGDHSIAMATAAGTKKVSNERQKKIALIWFDAHTDKYYDSRGRNFAHGIALSQLLNQAGPQYADLVGADAYSPGDVILIGPRDKFSRTPEAQEQTKREGFLLLTPKEIESTSLQSTYEKLFERLESYDEIHLSFDIDVVDDNRITGFGFPLEGGLSIDDTLDIAHFIGQTGKLVSADFVELMPMRDRNGQTKALMKEVILQTLEGLKSNQELTLRRSRQEELPLRGLPLVPANAQ